MGRDISPGGFVFEPRTLAAVSGQFGKTGSPIAPAEGVAEDDPRFQAAQLQHLVANKVREELLGRGLSLKDFLATVTDSGGMSFERLIRIQRGATMMQLTDLFNWAMFFPAVRRALADHQFGSAHDTR